MKHTNYKLEEYIHGLYLYITLCPFGECHPFNKDPIYVGSAACERCRYFHHDDDKKHTVYCKHP